MINIYEILLISLKWVFYIILEKIKYSGAFIELKIALYISPNYIKDTDTESIIYDADNQPKNRV